MFVGGYFALGHSTIVTIMCIVVAVSSSAASTALDKAGDIAGIIGTSISLGFLSIIGFANIWVLVALVKRHRRLVRKQQTTGHTPQLSLETIPTTTLSHLKDDPDKDSSTFNSALDDTTGEDTFESAADTNDEDALLPHELLVKDVDDNDKGGSTGLGCFTRCCPALLRSVDRPWKMYYVGFVFGLGFDTATEVGLLAITAVTSAQDSWVFAPLFALLFTSGMTLIDTLDGLMVRWAIDRITAERQLFFNIGVTGLATLLALVAAIIQAMSLVVATYPLTHSRRTMVLRIPILSLFGAISRPSTSEWDSLAFLLLA
jgi:high-affinity nickel-transport protein